MIDFENVFREERPRAVATLIRLLGDFDLAEDTLQEAFALALERWPRDGMPTKPGAWLVSTARHKALDQLRRAKTFELKREELAYLSTTTVSQNVDDQALPDDVLRLIFTCCHPALGLEAQTALTLKTLCGLTVGEIARAFLVQQATMAQRLVRAKKKIRAARIPYAVPEPERLGERLEGVLRVVYLVFNEGYAATSGETLVRDELCSEAIRLGRLLLTLLPDETEINALLALMLLHDSRRSARVDADGELVLLEDQDRSLWDRDKIAEGLKLAEEALAQGGTGFYALQAAIASLHAQPERAEETDWPQIAALYGVLDRLHPSVVVTLNRAVAVAMSEGPESGLLLIEELESRNELSEYYLLHAAKADLLRRLGRAGDSAQAYGRALALVPQGPERRFLERRLSEVGSEIGSEVGGEVERGG